MNDEKLQAGDFVVVEETEGATRRVHVGKVDDIDEHGIIDTTLPFDEFYWKHRVLGLFGKNYQWQRSEKADRYTEMFERGNYGRYMTIEWVPSGSAMVRGQ